MDDQRAWQLVLDDLEVTVSPAQFGGFIRPLKLGGRQQVGERQIVTIDCKSSFLQAAVEKRFYGQIQEAFERITKTATELRFKVNTSLTLEEKGDSGPLFSGSELHIDAVTLARHRLNLREDFILQTFAVSNSNEMAYAAAVAITEHFGAAYNPLFLYGGVGVGKTHLMQAIANVVLENDPHAAIICCAGEEFTNEIIDAIQQKTTREFKKRYRQVKGLFIDDIQFIAGKTTVQEEFFHTFNAILKTGGQVVMTSDRPPGEIKMLEDRLRSRFEAGLIVDIGQPDFELRSAITLIKAKQRAISLTMAAAQLIAANIESARQIEGFLVRLMTEATLKHQTITIDLVKSLLGTTSPTKDEAPPPLRPLEIVRGVADHYQLSPKDIRGVGRRQSIATPRHVAMYLLRVDYNLPFEEIGGVFSNRDHTTVMHAVDKITDLLKDSEALRMDVSTIRKHLYTQ
jgi:chromosomal replication initiator protein